MPPIEQAAPPPPPNMVPANVVTGSSRVSLSSNHTAANTSAKWVPTPTPTIVQLKDNNWLAWKTRIATVLKRNKAYEIVVGSVPRPQAPVAAAVWEAKDAFAQELIVTTIKDEQVVYIVGCDSAAQMWEALRTIHEPRDQFSIVSMKRALYTTQAKEGSDVTAHTNKMKHFRARLALVGYQIDDDEFEGVLRASLGYPL